MDKQKKTDPNNKDCASCGTSGAKLTCAACKAAHYCSRACQKQHWKNGPKGMCVAPEKRRPPGPALASSMKNTIEPASETSTVNDSSECLICLDSIAQGTRCTLPCKHDFHRGCVDDLRKHGVLHQACPLCRTALPIGPEDATRKYVSLRQKVENGKASWDTLTASQRNNMAEVVAMFASAADQGLAPAQYNLGYMYKHGMESSKILQKQRSGIG